MAVLSYDHEVVEEHVRVTRDTQIEACHTQSSEHSDSYP